MMGGGCYTANNMEKMGVPLSHLTSSEIEKGGGGGDRKKKERIA